MLLLLRRAHGVFLRYVEEENMGELSAGIDVRESLMVPWHLQKRKSGRMQGKSCKECLKMKKLMAAADSAGRLAAPQRDDILNELGVVLSRLGDRSGALV